MTPPFKLYGAEISYFTAKARCALRAKRVPFEEVVATTEVYRDVLVPRTGTPFLPTIVTPDDETLQDTSDILDWLEARSPEPALYPATPVQRLAAYLFELYADEFLILPALHYRWNFPESEWKARRDFAAITGSQDAANAFADRIQQAARTGIGANETTAKGLERHTEALLEGLEAHFERHPFLLGARPSLADCSLMAPCYAHFYLDAAPGRLLRERAPRTCHWIERMNHPDVDGFGTWLDGDALPETLRPLLTAIGREAIPPLLDTVRDFERWADSRPADLAEPPRAIGMHETTLCGTEVQRYTSSYTLWMVQRPLDARAALDDAGRAAVDAALAGTGCEALFAYRPRHRLGKHQFRLRFEGDTA